MLQGVIALWRTAAVSLLLSGACCMLQAPISALLTSNPELGPSPVSVSISAVNANVRTSAGALCTAECVPGGYIRTLIHRTMFKVIFCAFCTT